jgi:putative acetyltransferase
MLEIRVDDLTGEEVRALLAFHLAEARAKTPAGFSFALDLSGLQTPDIAVWTAWDGEALAGIAALKDLADGSGEVKSMRTDPRHLRKGVAGALLGHIIGEARGRGMTRLLLETGMGPAYEPAKALYRRHGFGDGQPFAAYQASAHNYFMQLSL